MTASMFAVSACDGVYKSSALKGDISGEVVSNGGFAVQKGNFIYYINGKQTNTADNTFGKVETGAIMRISKGDLEARNYGNVETVVPEIAYSGNTTFVKTSSTSGNTNGGLFIYDDYVYYSTPSAEKNSDGEIQNSDIVFKRAKLDGTEVMKNYYAKYTDNTIEYRFVKSKKDNVVYLLYLAKNEDLYGTSCTNLHSVNTQTNTDTLLAYNVDKVMFDSKNVENDRVYYTMNVKDFKNNESFSNYNQVYTVTADETKPNEYDFSGVTDYDAEKDPLYVNCGTLVYDGIGKIDGKLSLTPFNAKELNDAETLNSLSRAPYKFTLSDYQNGTLFYTLTTPEISNKLYAVKEDELLKEDRKPAMDVPTMKEDWLVGDGSNAANYTYLFDDDGNLTGALISDDKGLVKTKVEDGKLLTINDTNKVDYTKTFSISGDKGKPTVLFTQKHGDNNYVYYHEAGNDSSGYIIKRVSYDGEFNEYPKNAMPVTDKPEYNPVRILDIDCANDWYLPEMFDGRIFFSTLTANMTEYSENTADYSHIMVCDISNVVNDNAEIKKLNEKYEEIEKIIDKVDETNYENLKKAYRYVHFTGDADYIDKVIEAYVKIGEDKEKFWSEETLKKLEDFAIGNGDWEDYGDTLTVNGKTVFANQRDYYYALLGKMTEADAKAYDTYLVNTYLQPLPEEELGWYASLSTGAKAGFFIGVIGGSLIVIAAAVVVALIIIRKRKSKLPVYTKKRIKVDTTDDKSVDVYATEETETEAKNSEE